MILQMFLKGTRLEELQNEYYKLKSSVDRLNAVLEKKKRNLPDLEQQFHNAQQRLKEMEAAVTLEKKIDHLKRQIAWSQVYDAEGGLKVAERQCVLTENKVREAERKVGEAEGKLAAVEEEIKAQQLKIDERMDAVQPLEDQKTEKVQQGQTIDQHIKRTTVRYS